MNVLHRAAVCIVGLTLLAVSAGGQSDVWKGLRFLEGTWEGSGEGMSGASAVTQGYAFILDQRFLRMHTRAVFAPQEKNPEGEIHEDLGIFSYDTSRKTFVLRGFYVEGFVNTYVLDEISPDGSTFTFETERIENAPEGTGARLIFRLTADGELEQKFFVSFPGRVFGCLSTNRLRRKK
jgi:hypothetical protein